MGTGEGVGKNHLYSSACAGSTLLRYNIYVDKDTKPLAHPANQKHVQSLAVFDTTLFFCPCFYRVKDTLEAFLNRNDLPQIQSLNEFPAGITISQTIAAWRCIVDYQFKVRQGP